MNRTNSPKRLVKFQVDQAEHDLIRLAGALRRTSMAEFAKLIVLVEAKRVTASISLPQDQPTSPEQAIN